MPETAPPDIVLASASPFRRAMLAAAGVPHRVVAPGVDEAVLKADFSSRGNKTPRALAVALAAAKARDVSLREPAALVIGADQVLDLDGRAFSKPATMAEARSHLDQMRGRAHVLYTAVALARGGATVWEHLAAPVLTMRAFSDEVRDDYLSSAGPSVLATVGAYKIESEAISLFDSIDGDYFSVIGLPLLPLLAALRAEGALPS